MKNYIIRTSTQGYDIEFWNVITDLPLSKFKDIDYEYGAKYRHQSTTINQLQKGAEKEGYDFGFNKIENSEYVDYTAQIGNY